MVDLKWEKHVAFLNKKYSKYSTDRSKTLITNNFFPKQMFYLAGCIVILGNHYHYILKLGDQTEQNELFIYLDSKNITCYMKAEPSSNVPQHSLQSSQKPP